MAFQQKNLLKASAVQILNEISIEYNFRKPEYEIECLSDYAELPPFRGKCSIVINKLRNKRRDQGNITTSLIISTQQQDLTRNKKIVKIKRQI